jgi:cytochrome c'
VIAQYDADIRWHDAAAGLRDLFAKTSFECEVATDAAYRDAVARKQDLADLVRGSRPRRADADATVTDWSKIAARPPLMQRLNLAYQKRLTKWLSDPGTFRRNRADIAHEAQIVALLAEIIHREAFEFSDDETFSGYASDLRQAASDTSAGARDDNFERCQAATGRAGKACSSCHEGYRG